ncbi:hypothetical protein Tco_0385101 [Tanacetum coccineum]
MPTQGTIIQTYSKTSETKTKQQANKTSNEIPHGILLSLWYRIFTKGQKQSHKRQNQARERKEHENHMSLTHLKGLPAGALKLGQDHTQTWVGVPIRSNNHTNTG